MSRKSFVVGVGVSKYTKPNLVPIEDIVKVAVLDAIIDAGIKKEDVGQVICGFILRKSSDGIRGLYNVGLANVPIISINNNGATGASTVNLAHEFIRGGISDVVLAVGFENMNPGNLDTDFKDRSPPGEKLLEKMTQLVKLSKAPAAVQFFANAGKEYMEKYGATEVHFAKIAAKNHKNGARNPRAVLNMDFTLQEVLSSRKIDGPVTRLGCCQNCDGAAAVIVMSEDAVHRFKLWDKAVEIIGMELVTDTAEVFKENSLMKLAGYDMTCLAAKRLYKKTGVSPMDIDVAEVHDCFAPNEMISYEGLQLCGEGEAANFIDSGANTYGGRVVVNPSGGLIGKGHPVAASGVAQCAELVWQLRGEAGGRQVPNAKLGLQHSLGLGGATVVALYRKGHPQRVRKTSKL